MERRKGYFINENGFLYYDGSNEYRLLHETIRVLKGKPGTNSGWVCKYCKKEAITKYIATGHDHTDYNYDTCDCDGAAKNGKPWSELV